MAIIMLIAALQESPQTANDLYIHTDAVDGTLKEIRGRLKGSVRAAEDADELDVPFVWESGASPRQFDVEGEALDMETLVLLDGLLPSFSVIRQVLNGYIASQDEFEETRTEKDGLIHFHLKRKSVSEEQEKDSEALLELDLWVRPDWSLTRARRVTGGEERVTLEIEFKSVDHMRASIPQHQITEVKTTRGSAVCEVRYSDLKEIKGALVPTRISIVEKDGETALETNLTLADLKAEND